MKVKDLIKELKKLPQNLSVYRADHDHGTFETAGTVGQCFLVDKKEMTNGDNDKNSGLSDCFTDTPEKYVVIRP